MRTFCDPPSMPGTGETPAGRFLRALEVAGTAGEAYLARRCVPLEVAESAGVRFDADFGGRAALVAALKDRSGSVASLHGRYLEVARGQDKMLTFGAGGGVVEVLGGWRAEPIIIVEGLFDALSLAACGCSCVATIGRWAPWLAEVSSGREVWLAFDAGWPGEAAVATFTERLPEARVRRLLPPLRCKDWNTALVKRGQATVARWLRHALSTGERPW